jgi:hypothetical protein
MNLLYLLDKPRLRIATWTRTSARRSCQQNEWRLVVFIHIPKTAGTSLNKYFKDCLGAGPTGNTARIDYNNDVVKEIDKINFEKIKYISGHVGFELIDMCPESNLYTFTFLRDPKQRLMSWCRFHDALHVKRQSENGMTIGIEGRIERIARWLQERRIWTDNVMVRQLGGSINNIPSTTQEWEELFEKAIKHLERMNFVGFQDTFDQDFEKIRRNLGLPSPSRAPRQNTTGAIYKKLGIAEFEITKFPDLEEKLNRLSCWDDMLYEYAIAHRHS